MRDCLTDDPGRQRPGRRPCSAERAVNRSRRRGNAAVELGVSIPLILLLTLGATDFGRLFYSAVTVVGSSVAGAFFGAHNNLYSVDSSGMQGLASSSATNLESVTANGTEYCDCPDDPASGPDDTARTVDCTNAVCTASGYGIPRLFVPMKVTHNFQTFGPYPWIPSATPITRSTFMRVQ